MGTAMGDKCEICGREEPSVSVKLWVKKFFRVYKMCVECIRATRMLKKEGCECDIEQHISGTPETNYKCVELYGKKYSRQKEKEEKEEVNEDD